MIVFDTNLLVYAHRTETPENSSTQIALERAFNHGPCGITLFSLTEFWNVVTYPLPNKRTSTPQEASTFIEGLVNSGSLKILRPSMDFHQRLMQVATVLNIRGVQVFDLQIALLALESGATEFWTHDKNFTRLPGLKILDPIFKHAPI